MLRRKMVIACSYKERLPRIVSTLVCILHPMLDGIYVVAMSSKPFRLLSAPLLLAFYLRLAYLTFPFFIG